MANGVWGGLMVMLCWGGADLVLTTMIRQIGTAKAMMWRNVYTLMVAILVGGYLAYAQQLSFNAQAVAIIGMSSLVYVLGFYCYMRGCEIGRLTLVSPITSTYSMVVILLAMVFLQERPSASAWLSIGLILMGLLLMFGGWALWRSEDGRGVKQALWAMLGFGVSFFILGFASKTVPSLLTFFYSALTQAVLFMLLALLKGGILRHADVTPQRLRYFLGHCVLVNTGWFCYIYATHVGELSLVAPISSMYAGVTVVLAMLIYREKISAGQKVGIGSVLLGVYLLSAQ